MTGSGVAYSRRNRRSLIVRERARGRFCRRIPGGCFTSVVMTLLTTFLFTDCVRSAADESRTSGGNIGYPHFELVPTTLRGGRLTATDVAVRSDGLVFSAVSVGVAIFDGERWDLVRHPDGHICTSIAVTESGKVFAGFTNDIAAVEEKPDGRFVVRPVVFPGTTSADEFGRCRQIHVVGDLVCFGCDDGIRSLHVDREPTGRLNSDDCEYGAGFHPLPAGMTGLSYSMVRGELIVGLPDGGGFARVDGISLSQRDVASSSVVSGTEVSGVVGSELQLRKLLPDNDIQRSGYNTHFPIGCCEFPDNAVLTVAYDGMAIIRDGEYTPFEAPIAAVAAETRPKGVLRIDPNSYVLATEAGIFFFDATGRISDRILPGDGPGPGICLNRPFLDHNNVLWFPVRNTAPLLKTDLKLGSRIVETPDGPVYWAERLNGTTYLSTGRRIVKGIPGEGADVPGDTFGELPSRRRPEAVVRVGQSMAALRVDDELLFGSMRGLGILNGDTHRFCS
ncbi:MAG: hypothetical protein KDA89_22765, partial [Planctomycetaceae bacterium]|nr:hypothetical protein [Planctomycetaceae bacterium]